MGTSFLAHLCHCPAQTLRRSSAPLLPSPPLLLCPPALPRALQHAARLEEFKEKERQLQEVSDKQLQVRCWLDVSTPTANPLTADRM